MIGKVFGILVTVSFLYAAITGNMDELSRGASGSACRAVELVVSMTGAVCLWSGVVRVLDAAGFTERLTKMAAPVLKILYPDAYKKKNGIHECAANISANFLGIGNAALPLGLETMKKYSENKDCKDERATDDMVMFAVLATTPFQLLPVTLAAMREAAGSSSPYGILIPVWICEIATTVFAIAVCKLLSFAERRVKKWFRA